MSTSNYIAAALVAAGGIVGFLKTDSIVSAAAGIGFAVCIFYAASRIGHPSAKAKSLGFNIAIALWLILAGVMGYRFFNSLKIMPAGMVFLLSVIMVVANFFQAGKKPVAE